MTRTSSISGTFSNRQRSPVRTAAASSLRAAFFAPDTCTVPLSGRPPSIRNASGGGVSGVYSQWNGLASATGPSRDLRGPSRCRRSRDPDPEQRRLELHPRGREVGALDVAALERALSASRRASCAFSRSISESRSAVSAITTTLSGRTCRNPPAIAKISVDPPLRISSSPTPSRLTSGV